MARRSHNRNDRSRVAIVGAGVCGLGIGWRLAEAGMDVTIFERDRPGAGASRVAAGMLAAQAEAEPGEGRLLALAKESQRRWPEFARRLEGASGIDVDYRDEGTLIVALNRDDEARLKFDYERQTADGLNLGWLSGAEARRLEPHLPSSVRAAVYSADDHQVDSVKVVNALSIAFERAGGRLHEGLAVQSVETEGGRVRGIDCTNTFHDCDVVIVAAGAWSREIAGLEGASIPVRPLKGQIMTLQMNPQAPLLRHVLWAPDIYLVPRHDGRLIVGGTVEERGFDGRVTAGGMLSLLEAAWEALPGIDDLEIVDTRVGFRPTSRDDAPILGATEVEGLLVATGHHRNGILLLPVTADALASLVMTGDLPDYARPFELRRFLRAHDAAKEPETGGAEQNDETLDKRRGSRGGCEDAR